MRFFLCISILTSVSTISAIHLDQPQACDEIEQVLPGVFVLESHEKDVIVKKQTVEITIDKNVAVKGCDTPNCFSSRVFFDVPVNLDSSEFSQATLMYNQYRPSFCGITFEKKDDDGFVGLGLRIQRIGSSLILSSKSEDKFWLLRKSS